MGVGGCGLGVGKSVRDVGECRVIATYKFYNQALPL